jgi:hypothetical protein
VVRYAASAPGIQVELTQALRSRNTTHCARALEVLDRFGSFREAIPHALQGEWGAVVVLVQRWQMLVDDGLEAASVEVPELVCRVGERYGIRTVSGAIGREPVHYLDHLISDVVFSPLIPRFGPDIGVASPHVVGFEVTEGIHQ